MAHDGAEVHQLLVLPKDTIHSDASNKVSKTSSSNSKTSGPPMLWVPTILKPTSLAIFVVTFVGIAIALPVLYAVSERNQGISAPDARYHYLWSYGPTVVFTLIAAFWSRLDYRFKQLTPWRTMQVCTGHATSAESICLDYVSPWSFKVLHRSIRAGHWMVALSVAGNLLLTLMIVVSTGLFSLQQTTLSLRTQITVQESFNYSGIALNSSTMLSDAPLAFSYGAQYLNLSLPYGTTENYLFPRFNVSQAASTSYKTNDIIRADMEILAFDVQCERASIALSPQRYNSGLREARPPLWEVNVTLSTPSCSFKKAGQLAGPSFGAGNAPGIFDMWNTKCNDEASIAALTRTNSSEGESLSFFTNRGNGTGRYHFDGIICTPNYNLTRASITYHGTPGNANAKTDIDIPATASASKLKGLTNSNLTSAIWRPGPYGIVNAVINATSANTPNNLNDIGNLERVLRAAHNIAGIQIAKEKLLVQDEYTTEGFITRVEQRLFVRALSFGLLEASSVLLAGITVITWFLGSSGVCSRDPGSIGGIATILARSHTFMQRLEGLGLARSSDLRRIFQDLRFKTTTETQRDFSTFRIHCVDDTGIAESTANKIVPKKPRKWWQPFSTSLYTRALVLLLPIAVIILLEILHRRSKTPSGIALLPDSNKYVRYTWVYMPAVVMVIIRLTFDTAAFAIKMFQPYCNLRIGGYSSRKTLMLDQLGQTTVQNLWEAFRVRQISIAAISMAMMLAPFLTVVVSGLYVVEVANIERVATVQQSSVWIGNVTRNGYLNIPRIDKSDFSQLTPGMILTANLPYPRWTHGPFVFPTVKLQDNEVAAGDQSSSKVIAILPALRISLNCAEIPQSSLNVSFARFTNYIQFDSSKAVAPDCSGPGPWTCSDSLSAETGRRLQPGGLFDCYAGGWLGVANRTHRDQPGCPTVGYAVGRLAEYGRAADVTAVHCRPVVEEVDVETHFILPDYDIDSTRPPQAIESTARIFLDAYPLVSRISFLNIATDASTNSLNTWFKAIIYGTDGIPESKLLGQSNIDNMIRGLERVIGLMVTQDFNSFARSTTPLASPSVNATRPTYFPVYNATITSSDRSKLVQNTASTRVIQALLGGMVLCAIIAFLKQDTRRVLPKNPCSIVAVASLLAGSDWVKDDSFPPGAEYSTDKELTMIMGTRACSMGWWKRGEKWRFGIDVGQYDAKHLDDSLVLDETVESEEEQDLGRGSYATEQDDTAGMAPGGPEDGREADTRSSLHESLRRDSLGHVYTVATEAARGSTWENLQTIELDELPDREQEDTQSMVRRDDERRERSQ